MKKLLLILLALIMCISMCACSEEIAPSKDDFAPIVSNVEDNIVSNVEDNEIESSLVESSMNDVSEAEESELEEIKPEPCKHDYQITAYTEPTCTENGSQTYKCVKCSDTYSENVPAAGHDWENATCISPKTCKICQETSGSAKGHDWKEATCTEPKTCKKCNETSGSAKGHEWKDATCTEPKTCKKCNETSGSAKGHNYITGVCTVCKEFDPNYQDPNCYTGTNIKTVSNITGAECSSTSTETAFNIKVDFYHYRFSPTNQFEKYQTEQYKQYFTPYIEYLDSLGLNCTKRPALPFMGLMEEEYNYESDGYEITVEWTISSYTGSSIFVSITKNI